MADDPAPGGSRTSPTTVRRKIFQIIICDEDITFSDGLSYLVKYSDKYMEKNPMTSFRIGAIPFPEKNNIGSINDHFTNGHIEILYGCIMVSGDQFMFWVMNENENIYVNYKNPHNVFHLADEDTITLGDYVGYVRILYITSQIDNTTSTFVPQDASPLQSQIAVPENMSESPNRAFDTENRHDFERPSTSCSVSSGGRSSTRIRRPKIQNPDYKIMFTQLDPEELKKCENIIHELGGTVSQDYGNVLVSKNVTSIKSLKSVSMGIPLVSTTWLTDSRKCARFLDHTKYIINHQNYEYLSSISNFLEDWTVYTSSDMSMSEEVGELIEINGGSNIKINTIRKFSVYDESEHLKENLPAPHIEKNHFFDMIFQRKVYFSE